LIGPCIKDAVQCLLGENAARRGPILCHYQWHCILYDYWPAE
jgi:hypothetical protein